MVCLVSKVLSWRLGFLQLGLIKAGRFCYAQLVCHFLTSCGILFWVQVPGARTSPAAGRDPVLFVLSLKLLKNQPAATVHSCLVCVGFPKKIAKLRSENVDLEINPVLSSPAAVSHQACSWTAHVFSFAPISVPPHCTRWHFQNRGTIWHFTASF